MYSNRLQIPANIINADYPKIHLVYGDLDSVDLLIKEASKADIVCHFAHADHEASAHALLKGLAQRKSSANADRPGFFIHTSGTGILLFEDIRSHTFGEASEKIYDDLEGVREVTSLPDDAPHRNVDKIVLAAGSEHGDKIATAIVCPPTIYGQGRGPGNRRSHQVPELCKATLKVGHGIKVGAGKTFWGNVHVHDLSDLYLKLVEEAAVGGSTREWPDKPAVWGADGYYFCENGEHVWGEVSQWVASEAKKQGLIETDDVESLSPEKANELTPWGAALWGANSRARAKRARTVLKWEPKGASLKDEIAGTLAREAIEFKKNGEAKGHRAKAAGDA